MKKILFGLVLLAFVSCSSNKNIANNLSKKPILGELVLANEDIVLIKHTTSVSTETQINEYESSLNFAKEHCNNLNKTAYLFVNHLQPARSSTLPRTPAWRPDLGNSFGFFYGSWDIRLFCAIDPTDLMTKLNSQNNKAFSSYDFSYNKKDLGFISSKDNYSTVYSTYSSAEVKAREKIEQENVQKQEASVIQPYKIKCKEIGYKENTKEFSDCILTFIKIDSEAKIKYSSDAAISDEIRRSNEIQRAKILLDLGEKLRTPPPSSPQNIPAQPLNCKLNPINNRITCY